MYAIIVNGSPVKASNNAVEEYVSEQIKGQHPIKTINSWNKQFKESLGLYEIKISKPTLLKFQDSNAGGLVFENGIVIEQWVVSETPLEQAKEQLKSELATKRWEKEVGGLFVSGLPINTSDRSKSLILGKYVKAKQDSNLTFKWKTDAGWITINSQTMVIIGDLVEAHTQGCFDNEGEISSNIDLCKNLSELRLIDINEGWPV